MSLTSLCDTIYEGALPRVSMAEVVDPAAPREEAAASPSAVSRRLPYEVTKRALDVAVSLTALILLSPIFAIIAILVYATDGGPVLYCQTRVGKGGRTFRFYKFRSMVPDADRLKDQLILRNEAVGPIFKIRDDPRITPVGRVLRRYSLDELPQFYSVLRGDMSLVGPRPHLREEVAQYSEQQWARLSVTPGLICLREVHGRSNLSFDQWVASDLHYIRHRSLALDLMILLRAIPAVLRAEGAY